MRQDNSVTNKKIVRTSPAPKNNVSSLSAEMDAELKKLFKSEGPQPDEAAVIIVRDMITANPAQPRRRFDPLSLRELGASMRENGQLQECIVRPHPTEAGRYQLVAGERRWRAAAPEYGDITHLRCVVRDVDDSEALVLAIEENAKREDISPLERAQSLLDLKNLPSDPYSTKGMTWEEVARKVGLTRATIDRFVQLLKLSEPVQEKFHSLNLNEKHGRGLLLLKDNPTAQAQLLREIEEQELSGNQAFNRAGQMVMSSRENNTPSAPDVAATTEVEGLIAPSSEPPSKEHAGDNGNGTEPFSDTDNTPKPTEKTVDKPSESSNPLLSSLKPAIAHLTQGHQALSKLKLSASYRQRVRRELDLAQTQIDMLRTLIE